MFARAKIKRQVADVPESVDGRCCGGVADGHVDRPCACNVSCQSTPYAGPKIACRSDCKCAFLVQKPGFCGPRRCPEQGFCPQILRSTTSSKAPSRSNSWSSAGRYQACVSYRSGLMAVRRFRTQAAVEEPRRSRLWFTQRGAQADARTASRRSVPTVPNRRRCSEP